MIHVHQLTFTTRHDITNTQKQLTPYLIGAVGIEYSWGLYDHEYKVDFCLALHTSYKLVADVEG